MNLGLSARLSIGFAFGVGGLTVELVGGLLGAPVSGALATTFGGIVIATFGIGVFTGAGSEKKGGREDDD